ncbi:MAG TPA: thiamine phosphate synthase [Terriglobales bacterium]|jgi:thiamine-phosphate pyrophosphorylase|nr:thiamine phosphate synthase [Terriglobales bacterium]
MLHYYITDRAQLPGSQSEKRERLLAAAIAAARAGIDLIQLREKDLPARELEALARELMQELKNFPQTRLLVNSRTDVAIAAGTHGVHLPANDISASEARVIFARAGVVHPVIGVSCHTAADVALTESHGADFAVFGPVFEKEQDGKKMHSTGLAGLRDACNRPPAAAARMPVLALGGVSLENAAACLACGAAGIAAIRLFQMENIAEVIYQLRRLTESNQSQQPTSHPYWFNTATKK